MTNKEFYGDKIKELASDKFCDFVKEHILPEYNKTCLNRNCVHCCMLAAIWLDEEYIEPETDWSKVEVDTPILVKGLNDTEWEKRHFAKYENGKVYAWVDGNTSWTSRPNGMTSWKYAKLAEDGE